MRKRNEKAKMQIEFEHSCNMALLKAAAKLLAFAAILFLVTFAVMNLA